VARIPTQHNRRDLGLSPTEGGCTSPPAVRQASRSSTGAQCDRSRHPASRASVETELRRGERLFNYKQPSVSRAAELQHLSPRKNHLDGLVIRIVRSRRGIGRSLVDNRTIAASPARARSNGTAGTRPFARQDGPRAAQPVLRSHGFEPADLRATVKSSIDRASEEPLHPADGRLNGVSAAGPRVLRARLHARRRYIPVAKPLHSPATRPPLYTDGQPPPTSQAGAPTDDSSEFDTPQIGNAFDTAPF